MLKLSLFALAASLVSAIQLLAPPTGSTVAKGSGYTVRWTSVDTDPTSFDIALVNFVNYPPTTIVIARNVQTSAGKFDVTIPCSAAASSGLQINAVSTLSTDAIYAQTGKFALSAGSCCDVGAPVTVTFNELAVTQWGQTIKIVGNIAELGSWDTTKAVALSAIDYTSSNPLWWVTLTLQPGESIQYKYINVASNGVVTWERDPNHSYTVPVGCTGTTIRNDSWQQ